MKHWLDRRPDTLQDWLLLIAAGAAVFTLLQNLNVVAAGTGRVLNILAPFAGAIVLAYMLDLLVRWFAAKLFHGLRTPAIALAYVVAVLAVVGLISLVVPQLNASINLFSENLPAYTQNIEALLATVEEKFGWDVSAAKNMLQSSGQLMQKVGNFLAEQLPGLVSMVTGAAGNVVTLFTAIAGSVYMLAGKEKLLRGLRATTVAVLPAPLPQKIFHVFSMANTTFSKYITGQLTDAVLVGIETFIGMSVLGLKFAPLISVLVGVTNIIPIFGPFIGAVPSAIILLFADPVQALEFILLILVVQQIDGNFIAPRILGGAIGISGLWVLVAITVGGDLFGLPGMVVGVPVFAVCYALLGSFVRQTLAQKGVDGDGRPLAPPAAPAKAAPDPAPGPHTKK